MSGKTVNSGMGGPITGMSRPYSAHHSQSQRVTPEVSKDFLFEQKLALKHGFQQGTESAPSTANPGIGIAKLNVFGDLQSKATATIGNNISSSNTSGLISNKSSHQRNSSGELTTPNGDRRVFNFQLDSAFRMDLMKKRMGTKIELKSEKPKPQSVLAAESTPTSIKFLELRKQSLDIQKLAEQAAGQPSPKCKFGDLKSNLTTTQGYQTRKTAQEILENMPNKQALMGMIDNQKAATLKNPLSLGTNKLQDWKPGTALTDITDLKGLKTGITMMRNTASTNEWRHDKLIYQSMGGEIKKEPISIVRAALIAEQQKQPLEDSNMQGNDDTKNLLSKNDEKAKGQPTPTKEGSSGGSSYLFGGLERVFKKRSSEQDLPRASGGERMTEEPRMGSRAPRSQSREVHEVKTQNYYMVSMKYNYKKIAGGPLAMAFKEHFYQSFGALKYLNSKKINPFQYSDIEYVKGKLKPKQMLASGRTSTSQLHSTCRIELTKVALPQLTVVLDLDETLISVKQTCENANYIMPVKIKGGTVVKVRVLSSSSECIIDLTSWIYSRSATRHSTCICSHRVRKSMRT
jgi:hypothetical protein